MNDDYPAMLKIAGEMQTFAGQFKPDQRGLLMRAGANVKLGLAYSYLKKREEAIKAWDDAIAISPEVSLVLYVYNLKITDYFSPKYAEEAHKVFTSCQLTYEKIKASESFRKDSAYRQHIQDLYGSFISNYCFPLFMQKDFGQAKKIISQFYAEFESENDFGNKLDCSAYLFFLWAQAFRGENNLIQEQQYLKKSLYWAKQGKFVYEYLYLRLAAHELQQGNFEHALSYCDSGLAEKQFLSNRNYAQAQAVLLFAKSKIYEKMGRPETAREFAEKSRKLCPNPRLRQNFNPWWIEK